MNTFSEEDLKKFKDENIKELSLIAFKAFMAGITIEELEEILNKLPKKVKE